VNEAADDRQNLGSGSARIVLRPVSIKGRRLCEGLLNMSTAADFRILAKRLARRREFGAKLSPEATGLTIVALNGYADLLEAGQFLDARNSAGAHEKPAHDGTATSDQQSLAET
jgi:hypothetical protein